jgi:hypothetical protein
MRPHTIGDSPLADCGLLVFRALVGAVDDSGNRRKLLRKTRFVLADTNARDCSRALSFSNGECWGRLAYTMCRSRACAMASLGL